MSINEKTNIPYAKIGAAINLANKSDFNMYRGIVCINTIFFTKQTIHIRPKKNRKIENPLKKQKSITN